jgi:hypothetical protein
MDLVMSETIDYQYDNSIISLAKDLKIDLEEAMLAPELGGVYFSKFDFIEMAKDFDGNSTMQERKKIYAELFDYVDNKAGLLKLLKILETKIDTDIADYKMFAQNYKGSDKLTSTWISKAEELKEKFEDAMEFCES